MSADEVDDDGVPSTSDQEVDERSDPPAPGERRPVVFAGQAAAPLQIETGLRAQRHNGVSILLAAQGRARPPAWHRRGPRATRRPPDPREVPRDHTGPARLRAAPP